MNKEAYYKCISISFLHKHRSWIVSIEELARDASTVSTEILHIFDRNHYDDALKIANKECEDRNLKLIISPYVLEATI